jgi:hypothetical protein
VFLIMLAGVVMGFAARHAWGEAMVKLTRDMADREIDEMATELKRLRDFMAKHVGTKE